MKTRLEAANEIVKKVIIPQAKEIIASGQQHLPMFFIKSAKGIAVVVAPLGDEQDKENSASAIKLLCTKAKADFFIFVSEGWMLKFNIKKGETWDGTMPSKSPDRIECFNIMVNLPDGSLHHITFKIIRQEGKKPALQKVGEASKGGSKFACSW